MEKFPQPSAKREKEPEEEPREGITRREFLQATGAAAALGVAGESFAFQEDQSQGNDVELISQEQIDSAIARYERTGEAIPFQEVLRFLDQAEYKAGALDEIIQFNYASGELPSLETVRQAREELIKSFEHLYKEEKANSSGTDSFLLLKSAMEKLLSGSHNDKIPDSVKGLWEQTELPINEDTGEKEIALYNRDAGSIHDLITSSRMNCRAGTLLYLAAAHEILSEEDVKRLVLIYTKGHVLPGYKVDFSKEYTLAPEYIGIEMTSTSIKQLIFSEERKSKFLKQTDFVVVDAEHGLSQMMAGKQLYPEATVLLTTNPEEEPSQANSNLYSRDIYLPSFQNGFGEPDVPKGDLKRKPEIYPSEYQKGNPTSNGSSAVIGGGGLSSMPVTN